MGEGLLGTRRNGGIVDAVAFMDSGIPGRVARLLACGVLVSFGTTRDRGAISVTLTRDGNYDREYFRDASDALEWLDMAIGILTPENTTPNGREATRSQNATRSRSKLA